MRFLDFLLTEGGTKRRPRKNLWYKDDRYWLHDLKHRLPDVKLVQDEENEEVFAVDDNDGCLGVWRKKDKIGTTFHHPRILNLVAKPRASFSDFQLP